MVQVLDYRDKVFINFRDFVFDDASGHGFTINAYEPTDKPTSITVLTTWTRQHGPVPQQLDDTLQHDVFDLVRNATSRYRLKNLGRAALHDWGGVHTDFHELILIDRTTGHLTLLVAADD